MLVNQEALFLSMLFQQMISAGVAFLVIPVDRMVRLKEVAGLTLANGSNNDFLLFFAMLAILYPALPAYPFRCGLQRSPRPRGAGGATAVLRLIAAAATVLFCATLLPGAAGAAAGRWLNSPSYGELSQELAALQGLAGGPTSALTAAQQERLADLSQLQQAIATSDDRSQIRNDSGHNLGLFTLAKRGVAGAPPQFGVLAPGQETDDDFSVVGLYVPAGVSLSWGEARAAASAAASDSARVLRLLEGELLTVGAEPPASDAAPAEQAAAEQLPADQASVDPTAAEPVLVDQASAQQAAAAPPGSSASPAGTAAGGQLGGAEPTEPVAYRLSLPPFALQARLPDLDSLPSFRQAELDQQPPSAPVD